MESETGKESTGRGGILGALAWMRDLAFSVVLAVILIVFIYQPVKVEGTSMMPALTDQERIFINKFIYRFGISATSSAATWWSSGTRATPASRTSNA